MIRQLIFTLALLALAGSAAAQDTRDVETSQALTDALQQCVEAVNDTQASGSGDWPSFSQCIAVGTNACQEEPDGASTLGMVSCNDQERGFWDDVLNGLYGDLESTLDAEAFAALKLAQQAWIPWRDARCEALLAIYSEGSIRQVIFTSCLMETTAQRAIDLMEIMNEMGPT